MSSILQVEGDPTPWMVAASVPATPSGSTPVAFEVTKPLPGTLILSPRTATFALTPPPLPGIGGWTPCDAFPTSRIYLPSPQGVPKAEPGYELAPGTDLTTLREQVMLALAEGKVAMVAISNSGGPGTLALNGATVPFVILAPPLT